METQAKTVSAETGRIWQTIRNLWPHIWPGDRPDLKRRVILATLLLVLAKLVLLTVPYFFKWATDSLVPGWTPADWMPAAFAGGFILVAAYNVARIVQAGFNQLRDMLFASVGQHAVRRLSLIMFRHLHAMSLRFHLDKRTGGLSRAIERGTKGIETIVRFVILNTLPTLIELLLTAGILAVSYGPAYALVTLAMVAAYTVFTIKASDWRLDIRRAMNASDAEANARAIDSLLNFETVKYFGNEEMEARRFDRAMADYEASATKVWTSQGLLNFGQVVNFSLGMMAMMMMSVAAIRAGTQTLGDLVFINALLMQLALPLSVIGFIYSEVRQGLGNLEQMFDLLDATPEITDRPDAVALAVTAGTVTFDNVHFAYDPERPILRGISFSIGAGQTVAVVGPSGAGKSTLSRLLFRFYDVRSGAVLIDGQDVRNVTQASLRAAIGMVPQDTVLFNDTIGYNIGYGRPDASRDEIVAAAEAARIDPFIRSLPKGYDSTVGERGLKLSGGEKQRVAIARTILKAPPILILDEATSALDTRTEQEIQAALDTVSRQRTTLVIAHRLSTVVDADEIIVLEGGLIAERGRHGDLLAKNGLYARMWSNQRETDEAAAKLAEAKARAEGPGPGGTALA